MQDGLEKLKSIGIDKIYLKTHIAKKFIQDILDEKLCSMSYVQLNGFVSILEREYDINLDFLRERSKDVCKNTQIDYKKREVPVRSSIKNDSKGYGFFYKLLIFATIIAIFFYIGIHNNNSLDEAMPSHDVIQSAKDTLELNNPPTIQESKITQSPLLDQNESLEETITTNNELNQSIVDGDLNSTATDTESIKSEESRSSVKEENKSLVIEPKEEIWLGITDLQTHKKSQKLFNSKLELDANNDYLLHFGHSKLSIGIGTNIKDYNSKSGIRFYLKDGVLQEISSEEFIKLSGSQR